MSEDWHGVVLRAALRRASDQSRTLKVMKFVKPREYCPKGSRENVHDWCSLSEDPVARSAPSLSSPTFMPNVDVPCSTARAQKSGSLAINVKPYSNSRLFAAVLATYLKVCYAPCQRRLSVPSCLLHWPKSECYPSLCWILTKYPAQGCTSC